VRGRAGACVRGHYGTCQELGSLIAGPWQMPGESGVRKRGSNNAAASPMAGPRTDRVKP